MATAFQSDAFQNLAEHGTAGFQVEDGGGGEAAMFQRIIRGNDINGSDDYMVSYSG
jgi:hypothetical protein